MDFYVTADSAKTLISSSYVLSSLNGLPYDSTNDLSAAASAENDPNIPDSSVIYPTYTTQQLIEKAISSLSSDGKVTDFMSVESIAFVLAYSKPTMLAILYCLVNGILTGDDLKSIRNGEIPNVREYLSDEITKLAVPDAYITLKNPKACAYPNLDTHALKIGTSSAVHAELVSGGYFLSDSSKMWANSIASKYASLKIDDVMTYVNGYSAFGTSASEYALEQNADGTSVIDAFVGDIDFERKKYICVPYTSSAKADDAFKHLFLSVIPALDVNDLKGLANAGKNIEYLSGLTTGTKSDAEDDLTEVTVGLKPMIRVEAYFGDHSLNNLEISGFNEMPDGTITYYYYLDTGNESTSKWLGSKITIYNGSSELYYNKMVFSVAYKAPISYSFDCFFEDDSFGTKPKYYNAKAAGVKMESKIDDGSDHYECKITLPASQGAVTFNVYLATSDNSITMKNLEQACIWKKYADSCEYDLGKNGYSDLAESFGSSYVPSLSKDSTLDALSGTGINYMFLLNKAIAVTGRDSPQKEYLGKYSASDYSSLAAGSLSSKAILRESHSGISQTMSYLGSLCEDILNSAQSALADSSGIGYAAALGSENNKYALYFEALSGDTVTTDFSTGVNVNYSDSVSYLRFFMEAIDILSEQSGYSGVKTDVSLLNGKDYLTKLRTTVFGLLYRKYEKTNSDISDKIELYKFFVIQLSIMLKYFKIDDSAITRALKAPIMMEVAALIHMSERMFSLDYGKWYQEILRPITESGWASSYDSDQRKKRTDSDKDVKLIVKKALSMQFAECASLKQPSDIAKEYAAKSVFKLITTCAGMAGLNSVINLLKAAQSVSATDAQKSNIMRNSIQTAVSALIPESDEFIGAVDSIYDNLSGMLKEDGLI